ncbi:MAG: hypothetical protein M1818_000566 [Claussenomyces sp. TS43310]|nr:MAG: hypothetical protein M1818_000566 [Claussenomyces sp. TS43310]
MAESKFADGPFKLIPTPTFTQKASGAPVDGFTKAASSMALMHNAIIRALNSVYKQAPHVEAHDYKDFISYALHWYEILYRLKLRLDHHESEEEFFFPAIEEAAGEKGLMDVNVEQHHAFLPGLDKYKDYLLEAQKAPETFSGKKLTSIIDEFGAMVCTHLEEEIPSLLELARLGDKVPLEELMRVEGRKSGENNSRAGGVFYLMNIDTTFEGGLWAHWPPIPGPIRWALITFSRWTSSVWKFASCDQSGGMVELYALRK